MCAEFRIFRILKLGSGISGFADSYEGERRLLRGEASGACRSARLSSGEKRRRLLSRGLREVEAPAEVLRGRCFVHWTQGHGCLWAGVSVENMLSFCFYLHI